MARPVRVLLFATARTAVGHAELEWAVSASGTTARDLVRDLTARYPALARVARSSRFVRNGRYVERMTDRVKPGDEFAVHPPYGGG